MPQRGERLARVGVGARGAWLCVWTGALHLLCAFSLLPRLSLATAKRGRSGHYWIRFTSVRNQEPERLHLQPKVLEPVNSGPELALGAHDSLIPFSLRGPRGAIQFKKHFWRAICGSGPG